MLVENWNLMIAIQWIFDIVETIINDKQGVFSANMPLWMTGWLQYDVMPCFSVAIYNYFNEMTKEELWSTELKDGKTRKWKKDILYFF